MRRRAVNPQTLGGHALDLTPSWIQTQGPTVITTPRLK